MKRFASLDAVRGLAALSVFFAHLHTVFVLHHIALDLTPAFLLWAGGEAVILFFVLSGFVLVRRADQGAPQSLRAFWWGRMARIGLPSWVMLAACVMVTGLLNRFAGVGSQAFQWPVSMNPRVVLDHALMVVDVKLVFNDVVWTLVHEMRFALLFPLFLWALHRLRPWAFLAVLTSVSLTVAALVTWGGDPSIGYRTSWWHTLHYLLMFGLGAVLAQNLDAALAWWGAQSLRARRGWIVGALLLYAYARMAHLVPKVWGWRHVAVFNEFLSDVFVALAACVLMVSAMAPGRIREVLHAKPWQYLGRVSFSLYLVHIPVLKTCFALMPHAPAWLAVLVSLPCVALVTHVFHISVEQPAQRLGRWGPGADRKP
jgi:peptidoglycan/LPS O-acetylase OafA/YrhL